MNRSKIAANVTDRTQRRFNVCRKRSQDRQGLAELTWDEFLNQVLDVWQLHETRDHGQARSAMRYDGQAVATDGGQAASERRYAGGQTCPDCETTVAVADAYCRHCGAALDDGGESA